MGKVTKQCDMCADSFQYGPHKYDGQYLPHYEMFLCQGCYRGNWNGFAPHLEDKFIDHLGSKGTSLPERNEKGWFPR